MPTIVVFGVRGDGERVRLSTLLIRAMTSTEGLQVTAEHVTITFVEAAIYTSNPMAARPVSAFVFLQRKAGRTHEIIADLKERVCASIATEVPKGTKICCRVRHGEPIDFKVMTVM